MKLHNYNLNKKFCLITGAAGILGYEHARAILEVNGNVILWITLTLFGPGGGGGCIDTADF